METIQIKDVYEPSNPIMQINAGNNDNYNLNGNDMFRSVQETINIATDNNQPPNFHQDYDVWDSLFNPFNSTGQEKIRGASDVAVGAVLTSLQVNAVLFFALVCLYEIVFRIFPSVYRCNQHNINNNKANSNSKDDNNNNNNNAGVVLLPKSPLPLSWLWPILRVTWSQVRNLCGLDGYFFLRYVRMCCQVTAVTGLWGMLILWPIYATGGNDAHGWYHLSMANLEPGNWRLWFPTVFMCMFTIYIMYIMNEEYKHWVECRQEFLARGDSHVHVQQQYTVRVEEIPRQLQSDTGLRQYFEQLFSPEKVHSACVVMYLPDLAELHQRRRRVLTRLEKCRAIQEITGRRPMHRVGTHRRLLDVMTTTCPPGLRKPTNLFQDDERLPRHGERVDSIQYFEKYLNILNEKVKEVQQEKLKEAKEGDKAKKLASEWITQTLGGLGVGRLSSSRSLMASTTSLSVKPEEHHHEEGDELGKSSSSLHTLKKGATKAISKLGFDFVIGGLSNLHRPVDILVDSVIGTTVTSTGFVTFTDLASKVCAVRADPLSHHADTLRTISAPEPRDLVWDNAHFNQTWISGREWTANTLLAIGAILWSVPITAIQTLANLQSLARIPGLMWVDNIPSGDFLNGYLPVLALIGLIAVLPIVFEWIALRYEHRKSLSDIQLSVMKRFFYYQLANVYITVTAGSILDSLAEMLDHPSNLLGFLAKSVPQVVGYFVMFVCTKLLAGLPVVLLRVGCLLNRILSIVFCRDRILTQRELDEIYQRNEPLDFGREYPNQLLVIVIMFTYASIAPIILPVGALYFLGALVVYKKQLLLVYSPSYESGGMMFPTACDRTLIALICAQVTLLGYTVLSKGYYQPLVLLPLPFFTYSMMGTFNRLYTEPGTILSLERAVLLDKKAQQVSNEDPTKGFDCCVYRQPILGLGDEEPMPFRRNQGAAAAASSDPQQTKSQDEIETVKAV